MAQRLKRLPAMRETRVQSLGREDPLEKEMATHSSTLAWKIPWMEEPGRLQFMGSQRVRLHSLTHYLEDVGHLVVKLRDSGTRLPESEPWLHHLPDVGS